MRTQGGGGSVAKSGRPQIQNFTKIFEVKTVSCVLKDRGGAHPLFAGIAANRPVRLRQKAASTVKLR